MKKFGTEFETALGSYMDAIAADWAKWSTPVRLGKSNVSGTPLESEAEYRKKLTYKVGKNYIKIVTMHEITDKDTGKKELIDGSVHSFIVHKETKGFPVGTVLKAASWLAPATNFGRGNIFGHYNVRWTGV